MTEHTPQPYQDPAGSSAGPAQDPAAGPPVRRRRSLARRVVPLAVAAWAVLEIWLLILLGSQIGGLGVFAVLAAGVVFGAVVIKRAGRRAWRGLTETLQAGRQPASGERPGGSGNGLTMLAGLLLMFPGLVTDAAGLVLLLPPVRGLLRRRAERLVAKSPGLGEAYTQARIHRPDGKVVQGEVLREDEERPQG